MSLTTTGDRANSENILTKMHRSAFKEGLKSERSNQFLVRTLVL